MKTRFAPSPNGPLHLGHAYSALQAHDLAQAMGGAFTLRIEDIDGTRSRPEFADGILDDLRWLGLEWQGDVVFQSGRLQSYADAAARLRDMDLLYACTCTRAVYDGPVYPGTCRGNMADGRPHSWRLDLAKALALTGPLVWHDMGAGEVAATPQEFGDVILLRKDAPASYHLAAVVDDAADGMTHIVRGRDLFGATHIHRLLQALLKLPVPVYHHHRLLLGPDGTRLAKSKHSPALADLRSNGIDGCDLINHLRQHRFPAGISLDNA